MKPYFSKEFDKLEENGYESEYIHFDRTLQCVVPAISLAECKESWAGKGEKVTFLDLGGYDHERSYIKTLGIDKGDSLTVVRCSIGSSSSHYKFEELEGEFNTVMFGRNNVE